MKEQTKNAGIEFLKKHPLLRKKTRQGLLKYKRSQYKKIMDQNKVQPKLVIFESFMGRNYNCSPKAIFKFMVNDPRFHDYEFVWAFKDSHKIGQVILENPELSHAKLIEYKSKEYYQTYSKAEIFVTNSRLPEEIIRKDNQIFVQCWHGTPLKRLGHDVIENSENSLNTSEEMKRKSDLDAERYSYLLSPSPFCTEKFTTAFNLPKNNKDVTIIQEGYPRNDFLFYYTHAHIKKIKDILGIPANDKRKIILYAPTWRDNQHTSGLGYTYQLRIHFDQWRKELSTDYIVLFRAHYFISNSFDFTRYQNFVYDVSTFNDINQLYIISDLLITDYSSVFFDFANLKRPILFYMYDLEEYQGKLRDFYFDLEELPGEIHQNEPDLLTAIKTLDFQQFYNQRYKNFNKKFNNLDDGNASQRAVEKLLATKEAIKVLQKSSGKVTRHHRKKTATKRFKNLVTAAGKKIPWIRRRAVSFYEKIRKNKYQKFMNTCPINEKQIIFESYMGKNYACSPKALFQYMAHHPSFDGYRFVWAFKDLKKVVGMLEEEPELSSAVFVEYGSAEYFMEYASSKYFISNSRIPNYIEKKEGQIYIQTWHGSTFKKLGYDIHFEGYNVLSSTEFLRQQYDKDASRYDYLISPSRFCTSTYQSGFNLKKNNPSVSIIEEGYPRNDFLFHYCDYHIRKLRRSIGISDSDNRKIILYAPTWRDSEHKTGVGFVLNLPMDFGRMKRELETDYMILFRAHYFIAESFDFQEYQGFLYDVSDIDDINYLYVLSDMLITDYSSVFYDYANLKKQIVFYMYDHDTFSDSVRDFYLTMDELPGQVVKDEDSLIQVLNDSKQHFIPDEKYLSFNNRFNSLHDGDSSQRVIDIIFPKISNQD